MTDPKAAIEYTPRAELRLRCEMVLLQFLLAGRRLRPPGPPREKETDLTAVLRERELRLVTLTGQVRPWMRPMGSLAERLKLTEDEVEFAWAVVAVSVQSALGLDGFEGAELQYGLSVDVWARVLGISHLQRPLDLVLQLDMGRLVTSGLLRVGKRGRTQLRTPYVPSRMLVEYLAERTVTHALIGDRFISRDDLVVDAAQSAALADLRASPGTLTIVEGAHGSGRATAISTQTLGLAPPLCQRSCRLDLKTLPGGESGTDRWSTQRT